MLVVWMGEEPEGHPCSNSGWARRRPSELRVGHPPGRLRMRDNLASGPSVVYLNCALIRHHVLGSIDTAPHPTPCAPICPKSPEFAAAAGDEARTRKSSASVPQNSGSAEISVAEAAAGQSK